MKNLSNNLKPIYELEISQGNTVVSIDSPAGTKCPLAINFKNGLNHFKIKNELTLSNSVEHFINQDSHYPKESGYVCKKTNQVISGPLGKV